MIKDDYKVYGEKMEKTVAALKHEFTTIRAGRGHLNGVPAGLNKQVGRAVETLHVNTVAAPVDRQLAAALNGQVIVALDREHRKVLIHHKRGIAK